MATAAASTRIGRTWRGGAFVGKLDHADDVQSVVLSPDGSALAFGGGDKMVKLWDLRSVQVAGR